LPRKRRTRSEAPIGIEHQAQDSGFTGRMILLRMHASRNGDFALSTREAKNFPNNRGLSPDQGGYPRSYPPIGAGSRHKPTKQPLAAARRTRSVPTKRPAALRSEYRSIEAAGCPDSGREALGAEHLPWVAVEKAPERVLMLRALRGHGERREQVIRQMRMLEKPQSCYRRARQWMTGWASECQSATGADATLGPCATPGRAARGVGFGRGREIQIPATSGRDPVFRTKALWSFAANTRSGKRRPG
jgi:hypothetical protein